MPFCRSLKHSSIQNLENMNGFQVLFIEIFNRDITFLLSQGQYYSEGYPPPPYCQDVDPRLMMVDTMNLYQSDKLIQAYSQVRSEDDEGAKCVLTYPFSLDLCMHVSTFYRTQ